MFTVQNMSAVSKQFNLQLSIKNINVKLPFEIYRLNNIIARETIVVFRWSTAGERNKQTSVRVYISGLHLGER